jgi:hypothetical protein
MIISVLDHKYYTGVPRQTIIYSTSRVPRAFARAGFFFIVVGRRGGEKDVLKQ